MINQQLNGRSTRQSKAGDVRRALHEDGLSSRRLAGRGMTTKKAALTLYSLTLGYSNFSIFSAFHPHVYLIWLIYSTARATLPLSAHAAPTWPMASPHEPPSTSHR